MKKIAFFTLLLLTISYTYSQDISTTNNKYAIGDIYSRTKNDTLKWYYNIFSTKTTIDTISEVKAYSYNKVKTAKFIKIDKKTELDTVSFIIEEKDYKNYSYLRNKTYFPSYAHLDPCFTKRGIYIEWIDADSNSANGICPCIIAYNFTGKTIKYIDIYFGYKNRFREELSHNICDKIAFMEGPIEDGDLFTGKWDVLTYNNRFDPCYTYAKKIIVTYLNNKKEVFVNDIYYSEKVNLWKD